jgi:hypothetical protein
MVDRRRGGSHLTLAEIVSLPGQPETRPCVTCGEFFPSGRFTKTTWDSEDRLCSSCRAPRRIPDPDVSPSRVVGHLVDIPLPDAMRERAASGVNFRVELVLHIDHCEELANGSTRWRARWLEVTEPS